MEELSALRIGETAEYRGWSTLERTWLRTWPASKGHLPLQVEAAFLQSWSFLPNGGNSIIDKFWSLLSFTMSFISLVSLRKITKDDHLNPNFITFGNQPVHEEREFSQNSCLDSPFPVKIPILFSATWVGRMSLPDSGA